MVLSKKGGRQTSEATLRSKIQSEMSSCVIKQGYPEIRQESDWGWSFAKEASKQKKEFLTIGNAWGLLYDQIHLAFSKTPYDQRPTGNLNELLNRSELESIENKLVEFHASLPRSYNFFIRLFKSEVMQDLPLKLSEDVCILRVSSDDPISDIEQGWVEDTAVARRIRELTKGKGDVSKLFLPDTELLHVKARGYCGGRVDDSAAEQALLHIKTCLVFGTILSTLNREQRHSPWGKISGQIFYIDETSGTKEALRLDLPPELSDMIVDYELMPKDETFFSLQKRGVAALKKLMSSSPGDQNKAPLVASASWAFDSLSAKNETVSFLQLCIALEAILGDPSLKEGVTKTLSDRCAYLLGRTSSERVGYRKKFSKLYDRRSQLVHGRKITLDKDDREILYWGRDVLMSILRQEVLGFRPEGEHQ